MLHVGSVAYASHSVDKVKTRQWSKLRTFFYFNKLFIPNHTVFDMLGSLSLDIICPSKLTDNVLGQISEHISASNGDYCLYYRTILGMVSDYK